MTTKFVIQRMNFALFSLKLKTWLMSIVGEERLNRLTQLHIGTLRCKSKMLLYLKYIKNIYTIILKTHAFIVILLGYNYFDINRVFININQLIY